MRYIIQAVRERVPYVEYLLKRIPHAEVYWDDDRNCVLALQRVMELAGADPFIRLEDDVILSKNFCGDAEARVRKAEQSMQQFYSSLDYSRGRPFIWERGVKYAWSQATYFPAGFGRDFAQYLAHCKGLTRDALAEELRQLSPKRTVDYLDYQDSAIGCYLSLKKMQYVRWVPGLAQHRVGLGAENIKRSKHRQTPHFVDLPPWNGAFPDSLDEINLF